MLHETRVCARPDCRQLFDTPARDRSKYCSFRCRAVATVQRKVAKYSTRGEVFVQAHWEEMIQSKMDAFKKEAQHQILERKGKRAEKEAGCMGSPKVVRRVVMSHIVVNKHVPGSIAYAVLYGDIAIGHRLGRPPV